MRVAKPGWLVMVLSFTVEAMVETEEIEEGVRWMSFVAWSTATGMKVLRRRVRRSRPWWPTAVARKSPGRVGEKCLVG